MHWYVGGGWRAYLTVLLEWTLLFWVYRRVECPNPTALVGRGACGILATWPVFQFLLDTEVILYGDRLVLRTLGRLRSPVSVPLSDVREISVGPSHAYTLRVQLRDGRIVTVGPWGAEARRTQGLLPSE